MSAVLAPRLHARPMLESDLDHVHAVERDLYAFPWTAGNFRDSLRAGYSCWIYEDRTGMAGYAVLMHALDDAHLLNLSIALPVQRRGYGRAALAHLLELAKGAGARQMILEVRPSNIAARALYAAEGFGRVGLRRGYYPATHGREDAIVLGRAL